MSTRKRTVEEFPRMKVRGGRRRNRELAAVLGRVSEALAWAAETIGVVFDTWQKTMVEALAIAAAVRENERAKSEVSS